jgi:hypothetical protein
LPPPPPPATTVVVTPGNTQGWTPTDLRPGGAFDFVADATAPSGVGALQLTTDDTTAAKVQLLHATSTALADVTELSYWTKQNAGPAVADPSYQLAVELNGTSGFTTLVYEPYWNGVITPATWQQWHVDSGLFWSSNTITCTGGTIVGMAGGPPAYTLSDIETACPEALVVGFGVNVGTFNPGYEVETDLVDFSGTTYDFEPYAPATAKDQCKDAGWTEVSRADGSAFANQGDCVSYVTSSS